MKKDETLDWIDMDAPDELSENPESSEKKAMSAEDAEYDEKPTPPKKKSGKASGSKKKKRRR